MAHHINAIVGARNALSTLVERFGSPLPIELPFDLAIVLLDEGRLDEIAPSPEPSLDGFTFLTPTIAGEVARAIGRGRAVYLETDYFGGMGGQGAALFEDGALIWTRADRASEDRGGGGLAGRPVPSGLAAEKSPISEGLASLGVLPADGQDEFDAVGLGRFRSSKLFRPGAGRG